jgi:hypothetical protein
MESNDGKETNVRPNKARKKAVEPFLVLALFIAMATVAVAATPQQNENASSPELTTALEPLRPGMTGDQILVGLVSHNEIRKDALVDYTALRTYQVRDLKGKVHAEEVGHMEFRAPDRKTFVVTSESGSALVRRMAQNALIESEIEAAAGKQRRDSSIIPANYSFEPLGEQQVGAHRCFVVRADPKRKDKYLFEGKVWIDVEDYAVVRIEGHPAKKLSFWVDRADFIRQYQKIGAFWLPQRDETVAHIRLYGTKALTIDHQEYVVHGTTNRGTTETARGVLAHPDVISQ